MRADKAGEVDVGRKVLRRGAVKVDGRPLFNAGTHLLLPDDKGLLTVEKDLAATEAIFTPSAPLRLSSVDDRTAAQYARDMYQCVQEYDRWADANEAHALMGWLVTFDYRRGTGVPAHAVAHGAG